MAACDNLYGNEEQWQLLYAFLKERKPEYLHYMRDKTEHEESRICYTAEIQKWLITNCPFDWVKEQLDDNFEIQRLICGKAHHE